MALLVNYFDVYAWIYLEQHQSLRENIMKAVTYTRYGTPSVLHINETPRPVPQATEILVKVHSTTVTPVDCSFRSADPFIVRFFTGLFRPKNKILGTELAGEIVEIGKDVTRFQIGDPIFAAPADGLGAHAQYVCLPEAGAQIIKPNNMSFDEAASICNGALTALPFLRDVANIQKGQKVMINGASGSIGIFAVQLAKHFGADVTGVCSGSNMELVLSLGADRVIDYTLEDFAKSNNQWDIIFDTVGKSSFSKCEPVLTPKGYYLSTVPACETIFQMLWTSLRDGKKAKLAATGLRPAEDQISDMEFFRGLIEAGELKTIIDRSYPLEQIVDAHRYVETGHKIGNVVIAMGHEHSAVI